MKEHFNIAWVHSFGRPFLLTILLAEDLGQHLLLELPSKVTSPNIKTATWSTQQIQLTRKSILCLSRATGGSMLVTNIEPNTPIFRMLESYCTGTQQEKLWHRQSSLPTTDKIGPIATVLKFDSPKYSAKMKLKGAPVKHNLDSTEDIYVFKPNYLRVGLVLAALGFDYAKSECVSYRLFQHCRKNILHYQVYQEMAVNHKTITTPKSEVESLLKEA